MNRELTDTFLVTGHDVQDSMRSRRLIVWILLYVCVAVGTTYIFSRILQRLETHIARTIAVEPTKETGQVVINFQQSESVKGLVNDIFDDKELAEQIMSLHPLVIFYAWFNFTFMPFLVIIISSDTIARDVNTRNVRYHLFRTSRPAYAVGKGISSAIILLIALTISAIASLVTGMLTLHSALSPALVLDMAIFLIKCWIFNLSYLGIALMASQLRRSPLQAQFLALVLFFSLLILHPVANAWSGVGLARLWQLGVIISPTAHVNGLWHPGLTPNLKAAVWCLGLGFMFFFIGYARFSRRDL
jgi:ABC-type transport system involved in multi-copper enzyme maturation permease subunit